MLQFYQPFIQEFSKTERIPQLDHYYSIGTAAVFSCILTRLENTPVRTDCLTGFFNGDMMVYNILCLFYRNFVQSCIHLFFKCSITQSLEQSYTFLCAVHRLVCSWHEVLKWGIDNLQRNKFQILFA